ncbi:MAG: hypothetical protein WDW38_003986 [Sanguina aurantia]
MDGPAKQSNLHPCKPLNTLFSSLPTTIFSVMSQLAVAHNSVNLGQGFPDEEGPAEMKRLAGQTLFDHHNQYPSLLGVPELRQAVARHSERYTGVVVDWQTEALVTVGATEGIAAALLGLINPGDEIIMFDPMYDSYVSMAKRSGANIVPVKLSLPNFSVPREELAAAFGPNTKAILVNSPHNPSGVVFSRSDMEFIAQLCCQHDAIALCDEVYQHQVFGGAEHVSLRSLPGMLNRSIVMGSAGKTFSFTAWKVGWMTGPAALLSPIIKAHQFLVFTVAPSLQRAVAHGLDNEAGFYRSLGPSLERKRSLLAGTLSAIGFTVLPGNGAYFLVADASSFLKPGETDTEFAIRLTVEAGVTCIPISGFYVSPSPPVHLVRFCYCKEDEKLISAGERLATYFNAQAALVAQ